jgi:predicted esterase
VSEADKIAPVEHHLHTLRTGRYYTVGAELKNVKRVWFLLHGYAQLAARQLRHFEGIVPADTLVVSVEALSRFYLELPRADGGHTARVGAAWMTREDRLADIDDANGWLDNVHRAVVDKVTRSSGDVPEVNMLAFSQGVATCMRWIARGAVRPAHAVFWAGSTATDVDADTLRARLDGADVVLVAGNQDQFLSDANRERLRQAWESLAVNTREVSYEGMHELNAAVLEQLLR